MRVGVIHPPVSVARDFIDYPYFADLGAVQLAAVLAARGDAVELCDAYALDGATLAWRPDGRAHLGASVEEVLARVPPSLDAIVVALTPFHRPPARDDLLGELLSALRGRAPIVLADLYQSGQHYIECATVLDAYPEAEAWVKYDGEVTVPRVLDEKLRGVVRGVEPSLDALPPPAWDRIDLAAYARFHSRVVERLGRGRWAFPIDGGLTLPLVTSRGCPFQCAHCSSNPGLADGAPKLQRRRSTEKLRADLARLQALGARRVAVLDELLNVNERHFDAFLDEAAALDLRYEIPNGLRADYLEPRHFAKMKGRVTTVSVSAESGVQRVVSEVVSKRLDLAAIVAAAERAHAARVPLMIHFMIGLPGESAEEINATLAFAIDLHERFGAWPAVQYATPLPGTRLARGRTLPVVEDWGPMFQTAPSQPDALVDAATLRAFKRTVEARLSAAPALVLDVTYECNNHCRFCATGPRTQLRGHPAGLREILDEHRRRGARAVDFDGGEPTLNPELVALVRHARAIGFERVGVTTNGRLCFYADFAARLVRSGLTALTFSLHGADAETHAREVGVGEAFAQTLAGIQHARAAAPPGVDLGLTATLTRDNLDRLDEIAQRCVELGLRRLELRLLQPFGRATRTLAPDPAVAAERVRVLLARWQDRLTLRIHHLPFCLLPGHERFLVGDERRAHVTHAGVELPRYLATCRTRVRECAGCPHRLGCDGFWQLDDAPEPPWLVSPSDLLRPVI